MGMDLVVEMRGKIHNILLATMAHAKRNIAQRRKMNVQSTVQDSMATLGEATCGKSGNNPLPLKMHIYVRFYHDPVESTMKC